MQASQILAWYLKQYQPQTGKVVDFDPEHDRIYAIDLTKNNLELSPALLGDIAAFNSWVTQKITANNARYAIGGYMERRTIYESRQLFGNETEARSLHLGVDIWAVDGTPVYAPLGGIVHSFQDNDNYGDYGPTIILQHQFGDLTFYTLYGHLSRQSLSGLTVGQAIGINQKIGELGAIAENGHWPPHLHFQVMLDMESKYGDYPGVCRPSEQEKYLGIVADPALLLPGILAV